jgi:HTH-type transcriptional regulator / antitoxin HigA
VKSLKYTVIKTEEQYNEYCNKLESLIQNVRPGTAELNDEIELLSLLIEKWDSEHNTLPEKDPIELLKALMNENGLRSKELREILNVSKALVSSILNYRRALSKENIRILSNHFKVSQEAFNRPYTLFNKSNALHKKDLKPA